ncbi:MAG TPA: poly(R)-hydroxyalkanoic acid synthase subunit PhaE [Candidatus Competibacteraceae bacterium]|nr:poly(R)-hydroxyalkanoic acid synthase subunit PhaE [Candidatus Competibacteraceae bacterium]
MTEQTSTSGPSTFDAGLALKQARAYLAFGEQIRQFTDRMSETINDQTDKGEALHPYFAEIKAAITRSAENPNINPELAQFWLLIAETWCETAASLGMGTEAISDELRQSEAWRSYQSTQSEYLSLLEGAARDALDRMEQRLNELANTGKTITSLRELYNLWVDCNEETYGQMLRKPAYAAINGQLINSLLRCYQRQDTSS